MTTLSSVDHVATIAAGAAVVAFALTALTVPATIRLARRLGVVDEPGARSSHVVATPRLGGIAVAVGALAGLVTAGALDPSLVDDAITGSVPLGLVLALTALAFGGIGLTDDLLRGIPVSVRLAAQVVVSVALVAPWIVTHRPEDVAATSAVALILGAAGALWVIGYVNAFNFMDGVDGISGFVAAVVGLDLALVGILDDRSLLVVAGLVLVGAAAGFLPLNLRPATVFLGDGGSYFLGAWIAMAVVIGIGLDVPPEALLFVTIPYLADTSFTLVRRIVRRADWRASHHEHAYQQLIEIGVSHRAVAGTVAMVSALCAALGLVSLVGGPVARAAAGLAVVAIAAAYVAAPTVVRHRRGAASAPATPSDTPSASASADIVLDDEPVLTHGEPTSSRSIA